MNLIKKSFQLFKIHSIKNFFWIIFFNFILVIFLLNFSAYLIYDQARFTDLFYNTNRNIIFSVLAPDTFKSENKNILLIGDSYAAGAGEAFKNKEYDYSIAHFLSIDEIASVFNVARPGYGNLREAHHAIMLSKIFEKCIFLSNFPEFDRVIFFFYEGNDLYNNLNEIRKNDYPGMGPHWRERFESNLYGDLSINNIINKSNPSLGSMIRFCYLAGIDQLYVNVIILSTKMRNLFKKVFFKSSENTGKLNFTTNVEAQKIRSMQSTPYFLSDDELDLSLKVLFSSLLALREYFNKPLEVVYIPSPATINSKEKFFWAEGPRDVKNRTLGQPKLIDKIENHNLSRKIRKRISSFSSLNGFIFIDPTRKLMKLAESDLLYGPNDYHHFNLKGYRALYNIIQDHPIKK